MSEKSEEQKEPLRLWGVLFKLEKDAPSWGIGKTHVLAGEAMG